MSSSSSLPTIEGQNIRHSAQFSNKMNDRKAEIERKKARLAAIREEKDRKKKERERKEVCLVY